MMDKTMIKNNLILLATLSLASIPTLTNASDFGCKALLCFAGGKGVAECQDTIKKVIRDMAKGKGFPHCSMVGVPSSDGSSSFVKTSMYTAVSPSPSKCHDGETKPFSQSLGYSRAYYCKVIEINIPADYAVDKEHQRQLFNY